jgi:hypothetical protein
MSQQLNPEQSDQMEAPRSGLLLSVEPIERENALSAQKGDGVDSEIDQTETDPTADADGTDSADADGTDAEDSDGTDAEDSDGTDGGSSDSDGTDGTKDTDGVDS